MRNRARTPAVSFLIIVSAIAAGCSPPPVPAGPQPLEVTAKGLSVAGSYAAVVLPEVKHIAVNGSRLTLSGDGGSAVVDLPADADAPKTSDQWVLVTESKNRGRRVVTFTHDQSLEDFTMDLPPSDAELHYGTLTAKSGGDILVFAWGDRSPSYWGYVTIKKLS
ncbi:MAG TPA: hypothetical protein VJP86_05580 [Vicinamibacterales bacterium]|nr:hypothetical protein [Vicinamibacterales bacterium]